MDQMHVTGVSNGGIFQWYMLATQPDFMGNQIAYLQKKLKDAHNVKPCFYQVLHRSIQWLPVPSWDMAQPPAQIS